jgi:hypothetical protein
MKFTLLSFLILLSLSSPAQFTALWVAAECDSPVTGYSRIEDLFVDSNGISYVNGTIDTLQDQSPVYLSYDANGQQRWRKTMNGFNFNYSYRLLPLPSGNIIYAGEYEDNSGTNNMVYTELDALGDSISGGILNAPGFATGDDLDDVAIDGMGNVYLSGQIKVNSAFNAAAGRFDAGGNYRWLSSYPLLTGWNSATARGIEMCGDTGFYQLVFNFTGFGSLVYGDSSGTYLWQTTLPVSLAEYHTQLAVDAMGNAIAGGRINQNAGIVKVNALGDTAWTQSISFPGLNGALSSVVNIKTDGIANIYTLTINSGSPGYSLITAIDSNGIILWNDTARGFSNPYGRNKEYLHLENNRLTFVTTKGSSWLYQYNLNGQRITDQQLILPGILNPEVNAIDEAAGDLFLAGTGNAGFNIRRGFTARLHAATSSLPDSPDKSSLLLYPNPASGNLIIKIPDSITGESMVMMYSTDGKLQEQFTINERVTFMNLSSWSEGLYWMIVQNGDEQLSGKFIVRH